MKILFIAQSFLRRELGGPKVVIELAEAIRSQGHKVDVVGPEEVNLFLKKHGIRLQKCYASNINKFLSLQAEKYDVIDVDANHLYLFENTGEAKPLIVARSVLFIPHFEKISIKQKKEMKTYFGDFLRKLKKKDRASDIKRFYRSLDIADIINVSNTMDVEFLIAKGYKKDQIICLPYGIMSDKRKVLQQNLPTFKRPNNFLFLGTFDFRKGCLDIPHIFYEIKRRIPDAHLTLLGVKGLFTTEQKILSFFPEELHASINIVMHFKEKDLPYYLQEVKVGFFPSYLEGFGFAVLEQMIAGIPVFAYDAPGPSDILPKDFLVPSGEWKALADKIVKVVESEEIYKENQNKLIHENQRYDWHEIAKATIEYYSLYKEN